MKDYQLTIVAISLLCLLLGLSTLTSKATTTFIRSTIVGIDQAQHTLTFRTLEGQSWTLPVADPNILTKEQLSQGDQVSIELDLTDSISKIIKLAGQPRSEQTQSSDEVRP
jgi:hypothetical protein